MSTPEFDGETYDAARDGARLSSQLDRVLALMGDGAWRTLADIAAAAGCSEAGASARLRDLRKPRFGSHRVERRHVASGVWHYRVVRAAPATAAPAPRRKPAPPPTAEAVREARAEVARLVEFRRSWTPSYAPSYGLSVVLAWLTQAGE